MIAVKNRSKKIMAGKKASVKQSKNKESVESQSKKSNSVKNKKSTLPKEASIDLLEEETKEKQKDQANEKQKDQAKEKQKDQAKDVMGKINQPDAPISKENGKELSGKKTITINEAYFNKLVEIRDKIPNTGNRKISWNETFDFIFTQIEDIEKIKADVERLRKLIEDIALNPKVVQTPSQIQMVPVPMPSYGIPSAPTGLVPPPPPPPPSSLLGQSAPEQLNLHSSPNPKKMSEEEFNKPPSSGMKGPPIPPVSDAKLKEGHANLMKEMKDLFRSGKKILKSTEEEKKKEEEQKSQEEKELLKAEQEARRAAAEEVIDTHLKEIGVDLNEIMPNTKNLMVFMYTKLQEEKEVDNYKELINATIGDVIELISRGNEDLLSEVSDLLAYIKQDPEPLIQEIKQLRETLPERIPKIDIPRLIKIKEIVNELSKKLNKK